MLWKEEDGDIIYSDYFFGNHTDNNNWVQSNFNCSNGNEHLRPDFTSENVMIDRITFCYDVTEEEANTNSWELGTCYIE